MNVTDLQATLRTHEDARKAMLDGKPTKAKAEALRAAELELGNAMGQLQAEAATQTVIESTAVIGEPAMLNEEDPDG